MSDPIAPARGCAVGLLVDALVWVVILAAIAVAWVNLIEPGLAP